MIGKSEKDMTEYLYQNFITPEIRESFNGNAGVVLFPALSCVRLFDASMIDKVANAYAPELFEHWKIEDYGELLQQYKKSQLLVYGKGYCIEPTIRIMSEAYLKNHDEKRWKAVNNKALGVYREWLKRPVDQRGLFVVEESYHMSKLGMPYEEILNVFRERLRELPSWHRDPEVRSKQVNAINTWLDLDRELENLNPDMYEILRAEAAKPEWVKG